MSKVCLNCDIERPLTEYYRNAAMADGRVNVCKVCKLNYDRGRDSKGAEINRIMRSWRPV